MHTLCLAPHRTADWGTPQSAETSTVVAVRRVRKLVLRLDSRAHAKGEYERLEQDEEEERARKGAVPKWLKVLSHKEVKRMKKIKDPPTCKTSDGCGAV